jgi:hypothetical protein
MRRRRAERKTKLIGTAIITAALGGLFICAWDHLFQDHAGFHEVHFILRRPAPTMTTGRGPRL